MTAASTAMPPPPCDEKVFMITVSSSAEATQLAKGSCVVSTPIDVGGHSWRVAFYPNGSSLAGATTGFMSLYLLMDFDQGSRAAAGDDDGEDEVHVKFRFMMRDAGGGPRFLASGKVAAAFSRKRNAYGFERFVSRERFADCFKSDRVAIRCDLTVFPAGRKPQPEPAVEAAAAASRSSHPSPSGAKAAAPAPPPSSASPAPSVGRAVAPLPSIRPEPQTPVLGKKAQPPSEPPVSGLQADLGRLLATKEGADVEFEVGGKVFPAHKSVLAARSSVFKEEFFGPATEKDTILARVVSDMRPEAFEALLHFMYTDSLPETETMATTNSLRDGAALAEDLLIAAGRYDLKDLKSLTEDRLCGHVGVSTALLLLAMAERYQRRKLKKTCLGFIGSGANARAVMAATDDVENLARSSPSAVKDVIAEILDTREARSRRLIRMLTVYDFCLLMLFLVIVIILRKQ